ncbi:MAG TPA: polysaccharide deacetylase family protein [Mycobacteriales bacterium]|jgi:Predicted xylanase/chitin deacetylase
MTRSRDEPGTGSPLVFIVVACALVAFVVSAVLGERPGNSGPLPLGLAGSVPPTAAPVEDPPALPAGGLTVSHPRLEGHRPATPVGPQFYVPGNAVALTFDDGPDPRWTPRVLDLLRANHVHATFCLIGQSARAHPALVRRIVAEGNALCDHTWDHDERMPAAPVAHVEQEIQTAAEAIATASGGVSPRYFRAPGGNWSPVELAQAGAIGMRPLAWSVDPRDWSRPGTTHILRAVLSARPGDVILCHDGGGDRSQTVAALARALPILRGRGLSFVLP